MNNLNRLLNALSDRDYGRYIITSLSDIGWLTGFTGSAAYIVLDGVKPIFITDSRYRLYAEELLGSEWEIEIARSYSEYLTELAKKRKKITIQRGCVYSNYLILSAHGAEIALEDGTLSTLRAVKSAEETAAVKEQYAIAAKAFTASLESFKSGESETSWAAALEYNMKKLGVSLSFPTITASGVRGALPHGEPTKKIISIDDAIIVDFGTKKLYTSDYTRFLYNGGNAKTGEVAKIVLEALNAAKEKVKPGVVARDIDAAARGVIEKFGYGEYFSHGTGHGVGVDVHEAPTIRPGSEEIIVQNMIFTIEPGIYLPKEFGVRLEDTVRVIENGYEDLSRLDDYIYSFNS
ncbi:MAG: Xaa-Pro peptidase family protein [Deferribacteraceae bacterium]|jgi:Xaa-Pro aminopeptidase|nr:Xaa-Pro peptidase family protein [Deferribacteraceae bacterium]